CRVPCGARHGVGIQVYGELALLEQAAIRVLLGNLGGERTTGVFELLTGCTASVCTVAEGLFDLDFGDLFCLLHQFQRASAVCSIAGKQFQSDDDAAGDFRYDGRLVTGELLRSALSSVADVGVSRGGNAS